MTIIEVIKALERVKVEFEDSIEVIVKDPNGKFIGIEREPRRETKGGYFRVGNIAIKISEIVELK